MDDFFAARIAHIYLLYGLGFFTLGLAVALEADRFSGSRFSHAMRYLALFGLLHGAHEWIEMFGIIGADAYGFVPPSWWGVARLVLLSLSFAFLVAFGIHMLYTSAEQPSAGRWGTLAMYTLYGAGAIALRVPLSGAQWFQAADAWTRYALGVPGALLAAGALLSQWRAMRRDSLNEFAVNFFWAAVAFALYGLIGQTVAPQSELFPSNLLNTDTFGRFTGIPIQLVRSAFAALMALFIIRGLRAFEVERQERLAAAQRQAQEAIARRDELRGELFRRTVSAQEEERARLARELHDDTLQVLTGISAGLIGTEQLMTANPSKAQAQLAQLASMSSHAIDELRRLILDLRPAVLDDMGLVAAVHWYVGALNGRLSAKVQITAENLESRLPAPIETILFRIVQEGLSNISRHARATHVTIRIRCHSGVTQLDIKDDGVGFDPAAAMQIRPTLPGWGLIGIQERVALAGGQFHIRSTPGSGTTLSVSIPTDLPAERLELGL
jgi:signal transduction histidine kinase